MDVNVDGRGLVYVKWRGLALIIGYISGFDEGKEYQKTQSWIGFHYP